MPESPDPLATVREVYDGNVVPTSISPETSLKAGRLLVAAGYVRLSGLVVNGDSELTEAELLREFDKKWDSKSTLDHTKENGGIVGPYYFVDDQGEFCEYGVAIWSLPTNSI